MSEAENLCDMGYELGPDFVNVEVLSPFEAAYQPYKAECDQLRAEMREAEWERERLSRILREKPGYIGFG